MEGGMAAEEREAELLQRKLVLMGTDVSSIPCFRNSFLYGVTGGFVSGIGHFAFTSKIKKATSFGFWSYVGITASYWVFCRYQFSATKMKYQQLQYAMKQNALLDGTKDGMDSMVKADVSIPNEPVKLKSSTT